MINRIIFIISIFFIMVANIYCVEHSVEFKINQHNLYGNYDIIYYNNKEQIAKDIYKNNRLFKRVGKFPEGKVNFINYRNMLVAKVNIKNNKFEGLCIFYECLMQELEFVTRTEASYKDGVLDGKTTMFDRENRKLCILNYKNGTLEDYSVFFDYDNGLKKMVYFVNGENKSEIVKEYIENEEK